MKKSNYNIGFIGGGNMAGAIVGALGKKKTRLTVSDPDADKLKAFGNGCVTAADNAVAVANSDVIFLCVKPQAAGAALQGLDFSGKTVVSIMAGVTIDKLAALTGAQKIVRVMPNLNANLNLSFNAYCARGLTDEELASVAELLTEFGTAARVDEQKMDAVTGISGSGPAFVFKFFEGFLRECERNNFALDSALDMCLSVISGSAANISSKIGKACPDYKTAFGTIESAVNSVCSKGGTTIEGVKFLDENNFTATVSGAVKRAVDRAKELSAL
ncbi:MAG: pyrroline-5-carboxylate reductase [Clostridiales bacterium]|jgi:pyrroline-5-carboxylate reductase|nr:pyrroline-5-carboxylate reductase [Clostridiales bacterium]